ncbi:MAG: peptidoglycan DD-metalloendopeptidase family protein [Solirubrobacteraceae bacterium]|nr:peptidoglycan DD-metalloendopeptidase family protein [Solirubrobacteraceae bacterium]
MRRQFDAVNHPLPRRTPLCVGLATACACVAVATPATADSGSMSVAAATATVEAPAPDAAAKPAGMAIGQSGNRVKSLQRTLFQLGLPVARDGEFGRATDIAVRRYEVQEGLEVDGVVTTDEFRAMRKAARPKRAERSFASRTLRRGAVGTDVRAVQRLLLANGIDGPTHGKFTASTQSKVRRWQRTEKLKADGTLTREEARLLRKQTPPPPGAATSEPQIELKVDEQGYTFPIKGKWRWGKGATLFGDRGGAHQGVDAFAVCGTPLVAASAGKVKLNKSHGAAGNYVVITDTPTGEDQVYMHLKSRSPLKVGDAVTAGQEIGEVGDTGNADGCHLHFEIWTKGGYYTGGAPRNPKADLTRWSVSAGNPARSSFFQT